MLNEQGQLVLVDFKRSKRYVDIRGHPVEVADTIYTGSPFASNNQVRGLPESTKDDLESLGYLALLLLHLPIPWAGMHKDHVLKVRSALTLQQLFPDHPHLTPKHIVVNVTLTGLFYMRACGFPTHPSDPSWKLILAGDKRGKSHLSTGIL